MKKNHTAFFKLIISMFFILTVLEPVKAMAVEVTQDSKIVVLSVDHVEDLKECEIKDKIINSIDQIGIIRISVPADLVDQRISYYTGCSAVKTAYLDKQFHLERIPTDPKYATDQWNLSNIKMNEAWDITVGSSDVIVAVIDTGVNPNSTLTDFSSDTFVLGAAILTDADLNTFLMEDQYVGQFSYDGGSHGTAVASIIGSEMNNKTITGVAPGVKIMPIKVFPDEPTKDAPVYANNSDVAIAIIWAVENGADIINMSFGGDYDAAIDAAVYYAYLNGVILVAASGNGSDHAGIYPPYYYPYHALQSYPARFPEVIAVGSINRSEAVSNFSNIGNSGYWLELVAYGEDIYLPWNSSNAYMALDGTSFSAPTVTGVLALMLSVAPNMTPDDARSILISSATDFTGQLGSQGYDDYSGFGTVNAYKALQLTQAFAAGHADSNIDEASAQRIYSHLPVTGSFATPWDEDFYTFTVYKTSSLNLTFDAGSSEDAWFWITKAEDPSFFAEYSGINPGSTKTFGRSFTPGTYYVMVFDSNGRIYDTSYTLTLNQSPVEPSIIEGRNNDGILKNNGISYSEVTVNIKAIIANVVSATKDEEPIAFNGESMTFSEPGYYQITLDDVENEPLVYSFTIGNDLNIAGVIDGNTYINPVTITFADLATATLNGVPFISGTTVDDDGDYTLVVTNGTNTVTTSFALDLTPPVTNIVEGARYLSSVLVTFSGGNATLDGNLYYGGYLNTGDHTLIVTDEAGNQIIRHFSVYNSMPSFDVSDTSTTDTKISFTINPASRYVDGYEVSFSDSYTGDYQVLGLFSAEKVTISDLNPSTRYYVRIRAFVSYDGATKYGDYKEYFYMTVEEILDDGPITVGFTKLDLDSIRIEWQPLEGADGYELYSVANYYADKVKIYETTTGLSYVINNLKIHDQFIYFIRAYSLVDGVRVYTPYVIVVVNTYLPETTVYGESKSLSTIDLRWDAVPGITKFNIITYSGDYNSVTKRYTGITGTKFTLTGLVANRTYTIVIETSLVVNNVEVTSIGSNYLRVITVSGTPTPTAVSNGTSSVKLSWPAVTGALGYSVFRRDDVSSDYVFVADTSALSYVSTGLTLGKSYSFKVLSYTARSGIRYFGLPSAVVVGTPSPIAITGLKSIPVTTGGFILSWTPMEGAEGYEVCQASSATSTCVSLGTTTSTSFTKTGLLFNTTYYYQVRAYLTYEGQRIYGAYSTRTAFKTAVPALTGLTSSSLNYNTNTIKWDAVVGATGYDIYYSIDSSTSFVLLRSVTTNSTTHTGLVTNKKYNYKVRATKTVSSVKYLGAFSLAVSSTPIPSTPVISAISTGTDSIKATWASVTGASGYEVTRSLSADFSAATVISQTSTIFTLSGLATNVPIYLKVRAYRLVGTLKVFSLVSNVISIKPVPNTPVMVGSILDYQGIKLTWSSILNAGGYELYKQNRDTLAFELVQDNLSLSYTENGLTSGSVNIFKIKAYVLVNEVRIYSNDSPTLSLSPVPSSATGFKTLLPKYNELSMSWNAVNGATGYEISRSTTSTGTFVSVGSVEGQLSYVNTSLTFNATYYYKIRPYTTVNSVKVYGSWSATVSGMTALETVIGQTAAYTAYNSNKISWSAVNGASGYQVYRSINSSTTYSLIATVTSTSYINTGLYTNTRYNYKIRAYRLIGTTKIYGAYSAIVSATPLPWNPVITVASSGYNSLKVTWPVVSGANGYEVSYATTETGTYTKLPLVTTNSASISNVLTNTTYYVKVRAYRTVSYVKIYGAYSLVVSGKAIPSTPVMTLVSNGYDSVKITWPAVLGAIGYELYRINPSTRDFELCIDTALLTYTQTGLVSGQVSEYMIKAYRLVNSTKVYSVDSSVKSVTPIPSLVSGFKLLMPSVTSLKLAWTPVLGATGYEITKATSSTGIYSLIKTIEGSSEFIVTGLTFNTTTYYKIRAYTTVNSTKVYGPTSAAISAKTIPSTVVLSVVNTSYSSHTLSWPAIEGASGYEIYRSTGTSTYYTLLKTQSTTSFLNTALAFNTQYNYKVRAYKLVGTTKIYGAYSSIVSKKTLVSDPSPITNSTHDTINVSWPAVLGASGYEISIATSLNGSYTLSTQTTLSKTYTGLSTGTTYYIKLRAYRLVSTTKVYNLNPVILTVTPSLSVPVIQLSGLSATSATLSWLSVSGATDYEVRIKSDAPDSEWIVESVSALSATFDDLDMNAHYTAEVRAIKKVNEVSIPSAYSEPITFSYSETS